MREITYGEWGVGQEMVFVQREGEGELVFTQL